MKSIMTWNWQQTDWPQWSWDSAVLEGAETAYLLEAGRLSGVWQHLDAGDRDLATIDLLTQEALRTSKIEGEDLDRASVQSSVRRAFGMTSDRRSGPAEGGIAELVSSGFQSWDKPLTADLLFEWHRMVCNGRVDLADVGAWRSQGDPMQVVSGPIQKPRIHFEAPPCIHVATEMSTFIEWFNATAPGKERGLPAMTRAGLAHLWFVSIHPFEDGNGRIARALSEKALAQGAGGPSLAALATRIEAQRSAYYSALEANNKHMEITPWLEWFAETVLASQKWSGRMVEHLIAKTRLMDRLRAQLNDRQTRALLRMFEAGPDGVTGGMSAHNYITITGTSTATARRDLAGLVELGALTRTGEKRGTRYWLVVGDRMP